MERERGHVVGLEHTRRETLDAHDNEIQDRQNGKAEKGQRQQATDADMRNLRDIIKRARGPFGVHLKPGLEKSWPGA